MEKVFFLFLVVSVSYVLYSCESNEPNGLVNHGIVDSTGYHEYVDLGLTSGTKWATTNIGANSPDDAGCYFAWGETYPKNDYRLASYKWYDIVIDKYTKYNTDSLYGIVDDITELILVDDAATANWGAAWRTPSIDQFNELRSECTWQWKGNGYLLISKKNNNTLFLPANADAALNNSVGCYGCYWSRSLDAGNPGCAWYLAFKSNSVACSQLSRFYGISVRAVRNVRKPKH